MKTLIGDLDSCAWDDLLHYSLPNGNLPANGPLVVRLVAERKQESDWLTQVWSKTPKNLGGITMHLQRHNSRERPFGIQMLLCYIGGHNTPMGQCYGAAAELLQIVAHFNPTPSLVAD